MKLIHVQDDVELVANTNSWLKNTLQTSKEQIVYLPAGNTPLALYKNWEAEHPDFLKNLKFHQVDEVLTGPKAGLFKQFFKEQLPTYSKQMLPLADEPLAAGIALLGVGTNGHLAFHEPEINLNFNYGCVRLSEATCENLNVQDPTWGITYGAAHFLKCPAVLIIAKGKSKKHILDKSLAEKTPSSAFSYLIKTHPNCTLISDT